MIYQKVNVIIHQFGVPHFVLFLFATNWKIHFFYIRISAHGVNNQSKNNNKFMHDQWIFMRKSILKKHEIDSAEFNIDRIIKINVNHTNYSRHTTLLTTGQCPSIVPFCIFFLSLPINNWIFISVLHFVWMRRLDSWTPFCKCVCSIRCYFYKIKKNIKHWIYQFMNVKYQ